MACRPSVCPANIHSFIQFHQYSLGDHHTPGHENTAINKTDAKSNIHPADVLERKIQVIKMENYAARLMVQEL